VLMDGDVPEEWIWPSRRLDGVEARS
jgi:hypothetical protein